MPAIVSNVTGSAHIGRPWLVGGRSESNTGEAAEHDVPGAWNEQLGERGDGAAHRQNGAGLRPPPKACQDDDEQAGKGEVQSVGRRLAERTADEGAESRSDGPAGP